MDPRLEEHWPEAESLADALLEDSVQPTQAGIDDRERPRRPDEELGLNDVRHDLRRLLEQNDIYRRIGMMFPGVVVEGESQPVPVDVPSLLARFQPDLLWRTYRGGDAWPYHSHLLAGGLLPTAEIKGIPPDVIRSATRQPLMRSLANRLMGRSNVAPSATAPFTLHCRRGGAPCHGQTAFYTPAFFITLGPYGSVPTSPVSGVLPPGYYHFGVDQMGGGSAVIDYHKRFDIPVNASGHIDV